jgi:hypothetical protein
VPVPVPVPVPRRPLPIVRVACRLSSTLARRLHARQARYLCRCCDALNNNYSGVVVQWIAGRPAANLTPSNRSTPLASSIYASCTTPRGKPSLRRFPVYRPPSFTSTPSLSPTPNTRSLASSRPLLYGLLAHHPLRHRRSLQNPACWFGRLAPSTRREYCFDPLP